MGSLRALSKASETCHMLYATASTSEMLIYDLLKAKCEASSRDSIYKVDNKASFNEMLELSSVMPFLAKKWLFIVDYTKVKGIIKTNASAFLSDSSEFLVKVKNYKEFKEFKKLVDSVNDIYLTYIRYDDLLFITSKYKLEDSLVDFIFKSYSQDPEQIFKLLIEMDNGLEVTTRKQISEICGTSAGSINHFTLTLLKPLPDTEKGKKLALAKRMKTAKDLADAYTLSTFRNFLFASVKDVVAIKEMYLEGAIYDKIINVPEAYEKDEKRLKKYNRYLETIKGLPIERVMGLYVLLANSKMWRKNLDVVEFVYRYYTGGDVL